MVDGNPCDPNPNDGRVTADPRNDECRITVRDSQTDDTGNWTCKLTDPDGSGAVANDTIEVEVCKTIELL